MAAAVKILVFLFLLPFCGAVIDKSLQSQPLEERFRYSAWGNWCGPGHGGFEDCCGGRPCPACKIPALGEWNYTMNVGACLSECPPRDPLDFASVCGMMYARSYTGSNAIGFVISLKEALNHATATACCYHKLVR